MNVRQILRNILRAELYLGGSPVSESNKVPTTASFDGTIGEVQLTGSSIPEGQGVPTRQFGKTTTGVWVPQKLDAEGQAYVRFPFAQDVRSTLQGRDVVELTFYDGITTTTSEQGSAVVDLTPYREVTFIAINTQDQAISIYPQFGTNNAYYWDGSAWVGSPADRHDIPAGSGSGHKYVLNDLWPLLLNRPINSVRFGARSTITAGSGTFSIFGYGVPN